VNYLPSGAVGRRPSPTEIFSAGRLLLGKISLRLQPVVLIPSVHTTAFKMYFVSSLPNLFDTGGTPELWLPLFRFKRLVRLVRLVLFVFCTCDCSSRFHLFAISI